MVWRLPSPTTTLTPSPEGAKTGVRVICALPQAVEKPSLLAARLMSHLPAGEAYVVAVMVVAALASPQLESYAAQVPISGAAPAGTFTVAAGFAGEVAAGVVFAGVSAAGVSAAGLAGA